MTKLLTVLSFLILLSVSTFGQEDKEYSAAIKKMFELTGAEEGYKIASTQIFSMFRKQYENIEEEIWDGIEEEFGKTNIDDLTEMLVPIYKKHLTLQDIKDLIAFYETPLGKKFAESTPLIMQESMLVGQQWGKKIAEDFKKRMEEKGY